MAAGWTRAAEREPTPHPPRSFAERLRSSIAGGISGSLSAGRRWMSAGKVAIEKAWNKVTGRRPQQTGGVVVALGEDAAGRPGRGKSARGRYETSRVVEMRSYRASSPEARRGDVATAAAAAPVEEEKVEQMQVHEAVNEAQWVRSRSDSRDDGAGRAGAPAETRDEVAAVEEAAGGAAEAEGLASESPAAAEEAVAAAAAVVEARDSEPGDDDAGADDDSEGGERLSAAADGEDDGEDESLESERLDSVVESLLLAAGTPLTVRRMCDAIRSGPLAKEVRAALQRLEERYSGARGIHLVEVGGGYQLRTAPANAKFVRALLREKPARLGRAALETLSIIAYKQPATRGEIEAIRGVDADSAINTLLSKRLVKIDGRRETVGRPLLYATTPEFLEVFGLKDLKELPTLKEIGPVPEPEGEADVDDDDERAASAIAEAERGDDPETAVAAASPGDEPAVAVASENGARTDEPQTAVEEAQALGRNSEEEDDDFEDEDEDDEEDEDEDADGFEDGFEEDDDLEFEDEDDEEDEDDDFDLDEDDEEDEDDDE